VPETEHKIREIKGRAETNPFLQLIHSSRCLKELTGQPVPKKILNLWPGPVTLIVENRAEGTTAFRVPNDPFLRTIIRRTGRPVYSTSVNRSGKAPIWESASIISGFEDKVDLILDDGDIPGREPSTILDISGDPIKVIRKGAYRIPQERIDLWNELLRKERKR
jgi:L-threonylcarbamoyladenylate synthase